MSARDQHNVGHEVYDPASSPIGGGHPPSDGTADARQHDRPQAHTPQDSPAYQENAARELGHVDWRLVRERIASLPRSILISSLFINLLALGLPLIILQIFDRILPNAAMETHVILMLGLCTAVVIEAAMKIARSHVMTWHALADGYSTDVSAMRRWLHAPNMQTEPHGTTSWVGQFDALTDINRFYSGSALLVLIDLPFVAIFFLFIWLVGGPMVLVPIALMAGFITYMYISSKQTHAVLMSRSTQDQRRHDFIVESIRGITAIKQMATEPAMMRRYERLQKRSAELSYEITLNRNAIQIAGNLLADISMVSMITIGALAVMSGNLSIGGLACCSLLAGRIIQPVVKGLGIWTELQHVKSCTTRAEPLLNLSAPPVSGATQPSNGRMTFENLVLKTANKDQSVIDNVSFSIEPGEIIGLRGSDKTGRELLLKAIRGQMTPDEGAVSIDGQNVVGPMGHAAQRQITFVSAETPLFSGTVLDNLTMFRRGRFTEDAREAARLIGLENDIHMLPEGYNTVIGDGAIDTLSSGLRQRISIARALTQKPTFLLFDEANNAVDLDSDQALREGLASLRGSTTILILSNRPSFLKICDDVFEIKDGKLKNVMPNGTPVNQSKLVISRAENGQRRAG